MWRAAVIGVAAALLAGCGGTGSTHSVRDVEQAFSDHGVPFTGEYVPNPYLRQEKPFLPGELVQKGFERHLKGELGAQSSTTFATRIAWVFDSEKSARRAVRLLPLARWFQGRDVLRVRKDNVVIVYSRGSGRDRSSDVNDAIDAL